MFVVTLTYIQPLTEVDKLLAAHVEWLKGGYASGMAIASGRKVPRDGGVILARGERAELEAWLAQDPFAVGGVARYDIVEFVPSMAASGFEALTTA
ncbi:YciI family protein [Paludibacterium purpuratum]|uniref:Uncharacterized protein YciI n=1 Tax=Paludibacterium purpuratum TaxID=1144873 RepID=A0A4R7B8P7_9NEIS|nr:YciI family protein [Paludibacterium purpuratum]TDR80262.1 uncharacterized protein YciI [Paludibacterium purpuratum]